MEQRYLLVCSITTGRQFPEKKNAKLIIEGKFKDELLESDPVPLAGSPQINTGEGATNQQGSFKMIFVLF